MNTPPRGTVAEPIRRLLQRLQQRAADAVATLTLDPDPTNDPVEALKQTSAAAQAADRATRDYRNVFIAYTHKYHQPRPPIGALAAAQGVITQSFAKRYTAKTTAAIDALLSDAPDLAAIREGITALGSDDLQGISAPLDKALADAQTDPSFIRWTPADQHPSTGLA